MRRRRFLELCAETAAITIAACIPEGRSTGGLPGNEAMEPDSMDPDPIDPMKPPPSPPPNDAGAVADTGQRPPADAGDPVAPDAGDPLDAGVCEDFVVMYDTNAQALYLDGSLGPLTGVIYVDYVLRGEVVELDFWHGHGNQVHRFTLLPEHFEGLKRGERVTIETTEVESHRHTLFIDPTDPFYRVDGAAPVQVPLC